MPPKMWFLYTLAFGLAWSETPPFPGSLAQQGSSAPFRSLSESLGWSVAAGGNIPSPKQIINTAFGEIRRKGNWGSLGIGIQQDNMDSLYIGRRWHGNVQGLGHHFFAAFQETLQQQIWAGSTSKWDTWQKALVGFRHKSLAFSGGAVYLTGCLFPEFAIQWNLGERYRMNWMLVKGDIEKWSLVIGQEISIPGNLRVGMGWRLPAQIFGAGISIPIFKFVAETVQFWHPVLPSSRWASGVIQL